MINNVFNVINNPLPIVRCEETVEPKEEYPLIRKVVNTSSQIGITKHGIAQGFDWNDEVSEGSWSDNQFRRWKKHLFECHFDKNKLDRAKTTREYNFLK
jgi:hypothetical protein